MCDFELERASGCFLAAFVKKLCTQPKAQCVTITFLISEGTQLYLVVWQVGEVS